MMIVKSITLYCQSGGSDKVYQIQINQIGQTDFMVYFANARRGNALTPKPKTTHPVSLAEAEKVFAALVREKTKKGYSESPDGGTTLAPCANADQDSGVRLQMLNAIGETQAYALCLDPAWVAQEKHNGERRPILIRAGQVSGLNRRGEYVGLKTEIARGLTTSVDCLVDGEDMGSYIAAFDLLEWDGRDLRGQPFIQRYELLQRIVERHPAMRLSEVARSTEEKRALLERIKAEKREGVVFKRADATYGEGKPASGGDYLKLKFTTEASVIVTKINVKRSVQMAVLDENGAEVAVGAVTIPPNAEVPEVGMVIEVTYLYAYPGGSLFQPVFEKPRPDAIPSDCVQSQLKYKPDEAA